MLVAPTAPKSRFPVRACSNARSRERGFTLIEVVVAGVLLAIALALSMGAVTNGMRGASGSRSGVATDAAMARASAILADDVMRATTQDRRDNLLRDPAELEAVLQRNAVAYSSEVSASLRSLDVDDVVLATPTEFQLRADVSSAPGVECVTWRARPAARGTEFHVRRLVGARCGRGGIEDTLMIRSRDLRGGVVDVTPFSYRMLCRKGTCPNTRGIPGPACKPWVVEGSRVPTDRRRWVIGVDAAFTTVSTEVGASRAASSVRASIRGRETDTYRRGLGC